jgi:uncharacterized protein with HEPN domain
MSDRDNNHIERIRAELSFIKKAIENKDKEAFLQDDIIQHAISMSLITIGECANHLSEEFKENNPQIEWVQVIAVRNIAAHGYWQLNMEQIWQAMEEDIPQLCEFFEKI